MKTIKKNQIVFVFVAITILMALPAGLFAREIKINVIPGENWKEKREAQAVIWFEDLNGNYIQTLYVTERAARKNWIFSPKEGRPESLPVWYNASKYDAAKSAKKEKGLEGAEFDVVTNATPKSGIQITSQIPDEDFVLKAEFNTSFDYNDFYTKKNSGVNGQPSVVYSTALSASALANSNGRITMEFCGTGSQDGTDGKIHDSAEKLTTAKSIVKNIEVSF